MHLKDPEHVRLRDEYGIAWVLLERGELDVGLASTRGQIDAITGEGLPFTAEQAAIIKGLAERQAPYWPNVVSYTDIEALRDDNAV
jgi:hypothetical protein